MHSNSNRNSGYNRGSYHHYQDDTIICFKCGGRGHVAAVCPSNLSHSPAAQSSSVEFERYSNSSRSYYPSSNNYNQHPVYCHNCGKPGHIAKYCWKKNEDDMPPRDENQDNSDHIVCHNCHKIGHKQSECPCGLICYRCGESGHSQANCPGAIRCNRCLEYGHFASDCTNEPRCLTCNETGHSYWDCPLKN